MATVTSIDGDGSVTVRQMTAAEEAAHAASQASITASMTVFTENLAVRGRVRTTDATPTEAYRLALQPLTGYTGTVTVIGVDTANGAVRVIRASFAVKRLNAAALAVGGPVVLASHADAAATAWQVAASVTANDAVVTVTGAAGRTVDWSLSGEMTSFTPSGRTP